MHQHDTGLFRATMSSVIPPDPGPSPIVREEIHQSEIALTRSHLITSGIVFGLSLVLGVVISFITPAHLRLQPLLLAAMFGGTALTTGFASWQEWRRLQGTDPATGLSATELQAVHAAEIAALRIRRALSPPRFTWGLIGYINLVWLAQLIRGHAALTAIGLVKDSTRSGEWWRLLTAMFAHGSLMHVMGNSMALLALGAWMETESPRLRLPLVYLLSGLTGSMASLVLIPHGNSVGASGAIVGVGGYLFVLARRRPRDVPAALRGVTSQFVFMVIFIGVIGYFFVDNAGHAGGVVMGGLIALMTVPRVGEEAPAVSRRLLNVLGILSVAVLLAGTALSVEKVLALPAEPQRIALVDVNVVQGPDRRVSSGMTVVIEGNRIASVEEPSVNVLNHEGRAFEAFGKFLVAGTLNFNAASPVDDLRATWMKPVEPGASGDVVLLDVNPLNAFVGPGQIAAAVVGGHYYSRTEIATRLAQAAGGSKR
jgi:membrane associated rhomboid family serine protease